MKKFIFALMLFVIACTTTTFAATGEWKKNDNNEWQYIKKDGEVVTEQWMKGANDFWYYLNDRGIAVADQLVEDGDYLYYVDDEGKMIKNEWRKISGGEYDDRWMYFNSNGRAHRDGWKTINDKKYFFEDNCMNYGYLDADGRMIDDADCPYKNATYYCGTNDSGSRVTAAWKKADDPDSEEGYIWLYFGSNGQKYNDSEKTIGGKKYLFNAEGKMLTEFHDASTSIYEATVSNYFKNDGAKLKKGWVWTRLGDDEDEHWFYANSNGTLYKSEVKRINGKKYAFDDEGRMLTGLVKVTEDGYVISKISSLYELNDDDTYMYFTENDDPSKQGAAAAGKTEIEIDGDKHTIYFTSGGFAYCDGAQVKKNYFYDDSILYASEDPTYKYEPRMTEDGNWYIVHMSTGAAKKRGTFTDSDNGIRYIIRDNVITIQHKDSNGKWIDD